MFAGDDAEEKSLRKMKDMEDDVCKKGLKSNDWRGSKGAFIQAGGTLHTAHTHGLAKVSITGNGVSVDVGGSALSGLLVWMGRWMATCAGICQQSAFLFRRVRRGSMTEKKK